MLNPFHYGGVVGEEAFCNRKQELADLRRAMENGERLFIYSERRLGKTSLVRLALSRLSQRDYIPVYVDLWPTDGAESFVAMTARAITESLATTAERMLQTARDFFGRLAVTLTVDSQGNPQARFELREREAKTPELEEVLSAPARIASRRNRRVVIAFDEFQRTLEYSNDLVERTLRSTIQDQQGVSYVFLGSRKHLIQRMVLDQSSPLYRAGGHYPLNPISTEEWVPFIRERFETTGKKILDDHIRMICRLTEGHPFYTQHLCHAMWELCEPKAAVNEKTIDDAVKLLLERESYAYTTVWESLTQMQRRFLRGLATEPEQVKVFSVAFVQQHGLGTPSTVQGVVGSLLEKDIIDRSNGSFLISDRFFRIWIKRYAALE
jgi:hypothetical protein